MDSVSHTESAYNFSQLHLKAASELEKQSTRSFFSSSYSFRKGSADQGSDVHPKEELELPQVKKKTSKRGIFTVHKVSCNELAPKDLNGKSTVVTKKKEAVTLT